MAAEASAAGTEVGKAYGTGAVVALGSTGWHEAMAEGTRRAIIATKAEIIADLGPSLKQAIATAEDDVDAAMDDLRWMLKHPAKWEKTVDDVAAKIKRMGERSERAIENGRPGQAAALQATRLRLIGIWEQLTGQTYTEGQRSMTGWANGAKTTDGKPTTVVGGVVSSIRGRLVTLKEAAHGYGYNTIAAYASGLSEADYLAVNAGRGVVRAVGNVFRASSPPTSPLNPMRDIVTWGRRTMEAYGHGFELEGPAVAARAARALGPLARAFDAQAGGLSLGVLGELRVRHEIDLRNAPAGITNEGVAALVNGPDDATIYLRQLRQAELLPATI